MVLLYLFLCSHFLCVLLVLLTYFKCVAGDHDRYGSDLQCPTQAVSDAWFSADGTVLEDEGPAGGGELLELGVDFLRPTARPSFDSDFLLCNGHDVRKGSCTTDQIQLHEAASPRCGEQNSPGTLIQNHLFFP